ncbi:TRAP transporter large permease subunit [Planctomycetota bacterium]
MIRKAVEIGVGLACAAMTLVVVVAVVLRYALGQGLHFSEDLSRYLMVFVVFLSSALVLADDQHLGIKVVWQRCPVRARPWLTLLSQGLTLVFLLFVGLEGLWILPAQMKVMVVTMGGFPLGIFYAAIPLGCGLMVYFLLPKIKATLDEIKGQQEGSVRVLDLLPAILFLAVLVIPLILLRTGVSDGVIMILLLVCFFTLVLLGMPVAFAIGLAGCLFLLLLPKAPVLAVPTLVFGGVSPFALMAIPLFILTGLLIQRSGVLEDLVKFSDALVGHLPGGLAHVTIVGSMFFASVCGVALAASAAVGALMIPMMIKQGYGKRFSAAVTASASIVGPIIPPSVAMIIYSNATGGKVSIGGLFLTGVVPGVLLGLGMMILTYFIAKKRQYPVSSDKFNWGQVGRTGVRALPGLVVPVVILVGIVLGAYTPSEAGGVTTAYALILGLFVTRKLKAADIWYCLIETGKITAVVFMLLAGAKIVGFLLSIYQAPVHLATQLQDLTTNPYLFIALSMTALVLIGFVLEAVATMVMLVPILAPVAATYGIDPYHYGLVVVMTVQLALITPPVALGLFIVSRMAETTIEDVVKDAWPYVVLIYALILLIAFFPQLTLWLPRLAGYL